MHNKCTQTHTYTHPGAANPLRPHCFLKMTQYFCKLMKNHEISHTSFSIRLHHRGYKGKSKGLQVFKLRGDYVHSCSWCITVEICGRGKNNPPLQVWYKYSGFSSSNSLWYSWSWYMLVRHARLNNMRQFPVNNRSAFAPLEVSGGFVIDLSGIRWGWLLFFQNLGWMCLVNCFRNELENPECYQSRWA